MPNFPDILRTTYHRDPIIYRFLLALKTPLSRSACAIGPTENDNKPNRTLMRLLLILVSVLALSGCGPREKNQENKLFSRYCKIPSNGGSGLDIQADENGNFLTVMVYSSDDYSQLLPGKVYIETTPEKLQELEALDLSEESLSSIFNPEKNIGIECEYYEADGKPILNRVVADTYKNGAKLNLGEVWSK